MMNQIWRSEQFCVNLTVAGQTAWFTTDQGRWEKDWAIENGIFYWLSLWNSRLLRSWGLPAMTEIQWAGMFCWDLGIADETAWFATSQERWEEDCTIENGVFLGFSYETQNFSEVEGCPQWLKLSEPDCFVGTWAFQIGKFDLPRTENSGKNIALVQLVLFSSLSYGIPFWHDA